MLPEFSFLSLCEFESKEGSSTACSWRRCSALAVTSKGGRHKLSISSFSRARYEDCVLSHLRPYNSIFYSFHQKLKLVSLRLVLFLVARVFSVFEREISRSANKNVRKRTRYAVRFSVREIVENSLLDDTSNSDLIF